jgi:hypothetical protein
MLFRFSVGRGRRGPASDGATDPQKFKGWRYPYGWTRAD